MSEQVSEELLKAMNEISDNETKIAKIDASLFIRNSRQMINEKVEYLYNILKVEAKYCGQKQDNYFDDVELIITHFKQKLHMVYDEFYCQYVNIQNESQEAKINRREAIIDFQNLINNSEKNPNLQINDLKAEIIKKNDICKEIINKCEVKFEDNRKKFTKNDDIRLFKEIRYEDGAETDKQVLTNANVNGVNGSSTKKGKRYSFTWGLS